MPKLFPSTWKKRKGDVVILVKVLSLGSEKHIAGCVENFDNSKICYNAVGIPEFSLVTKHATKVQILYGTI